MLYNVWTKVQKPLNNHERAARDAAEKLKRETPQPIPGRPGWSICNGKQSYNPIEDPEWAGHIKRLDDAEQAKKKAAQWECAEELFTDPYTDLHHQYVVGIDWGSSEPSAMQFAAAQEFFAQQRITSGTPRIQDILLSARSRAEFEELLEKHKPPGVLVERYFNNSVYSCEERSDRPGVLLVTMPLDWAEAPNPKTTVVGDSMELRDETYPLTLGVMRDANGNIVIGKQASPAVTPDAVHLKTEQANLWASPEILRLWRDTYEEYCRGLL